MQRAPRALRMAVAIQSSVKFGMKRVFLIGTTNFMTNTADVATSKFLKRGLRKILLLILLKTVMTTFPILQLYPEV